MTLSRNLKQPFHRKLDSVNHRVCDANVLGRVIVPDLVEIAQRDGFEEQLPHPALLCLAAVLWRNRAKASAPSSDSLRSASAIRASSSPGLKSPVESCCSREQSPARTTSSAVAYWPDARRCWINL